ncbi:unnamed protein product [Caenorhabditis auriculariae]|uniref:Uncharacterized protein n=1 Tax=Caenorhabditis auriculariae TaxID=2777116 RepID=A0A8S1H7S5_9PELO|nr:unnamed protein product [Caenorhabditis auriculariae]
MAEPVIASALLGCVGCQAGVEYLQTKVKESLNLLTFASFCFTAFIGLIFQSRFFTVSNRIPISAYVQIVVIFFIVNMANNYAIKFDIYFPLFIIFKSGTLLVNMLLGAVLRNYRYTFSQISAVIIVTIGIVLFTLASYTPKEKTSAVHGLWLPVPPFFIGILLLTIALVLSAYLGIIQEQFYQTYGKHNDEMMFYVHFLSIPAFALLGEELKDAWSAANATSTIGLGVPSAWAYIAAICVLQYLCTRSVYKLSSVTSSLNVTMVITLRKFLSILISFVVFDNSFSFWHALGAALVFIGSILFTKSF